MKSIAGKEFEIIVPYEVGEKTFNISNITLEDEFEMDIFFHEILKAEKAEGEVENKSESESESKTEKKMSKPVFNFMMDALKTKKRLIEFSELARKIVKELEDDSIFNCIIHFYSIIFHIEYYKLNLKKK